VRGGIYKKQEEEASMAAILWRKKLVLHRSLAGVSIGINQNPIMHAPAPERPRDLLSRAEEIDGATRRKQLASSRPEKLWRVSGAGQLGYASYATAAGSE